MGTTTWVSAAALSVALFVAGCKTPSLSPPVPRKPTKALKIGCITPLTGDGASYGKQTKQGVDLAVKKINTSGGVKGSLLAVVYEDDQMDPKAATSAIQKLIGTDKVPVILGAFGSSITLAIAPVAEKSKVVLLSASSTADKIRDAGDYIFRNVPPNVRQAETAAEFCAARLKASRVAILNMNNDYGLSLRDAFRRSFSQTGGKIVGVESYNPGASDFRSQLSKLSRLNPQAVYFPGHYQESGLVLKQAKELGTKATFVGGDGSVAPELLKLAGNAADGSYYTMMAMGYGVADEQIKAFTAAFRAKYGGEPSVYASYAYDAVMLIGDAIARGGYGAEGIKKALYATEGFNGVTGVTSFDRSGEVDKPFYVYEVKQGAFHLLRWTARGEQHGKDTEATQ